MNNFKKKILIFIKKLIKEFLFKYSWKLEKIYVQKEAVGPPPTIAEINMLLNCSGIIHFGAHRGQEAEIYDWFKKKVIWIEANPKVFIDLKIKTKQFPNQTAYCHLVSEKSNEEMIFNVSNNDGASSSIHEFGELSVGKKTLWPKKKMLRYIDKIKIQSISIDDFIEKNKININNFDHWVLDLQGSELLALKGAKKNLKFCKSLVVEVSNGEVYKDGPNYTDIIEYLKKFNFKNVNEMSDDHENMYFTKS